MELVSILHAYGLAICVGNASVVDGKAVSSDLQIRSFGSTSIRPSKSSAVFGRYGHAADVHAQHDCEHILGLCGSMLPVRRCSLLFQVVN